MYAQTTGPPPPPYVKNAEQNTPQIVPAPAVRPPLPPDPPPAALPIHPPTPFELLVQVVQPSKRGRGASKKTKAEEVKAYGPIPLTADVGWGDFIGFIAKELSCRDEQLNVSTFEWRWSKPANSPWIPVQTETGLLSMLNKIVKSPPTGYVLLHMQLPKIATQSPWTHGVGGSHADEDDYSDREVVRKKIRLDDELDDIAEKIAEKYPQGLCALHPMIPCYHHRPSDLHFELDRPRRLVWASAIKKRETTIDKIPVNSNLFKAQHALKRAAPSSTAATTTASSTTIPDLHPAVDPVTPGPLTIPNTFPGLPTTPNALAAAAFNPFINPMMAMNPMMMPFLAAMQVPGMGMPAWNNALPVTKLAPTTPPYQSDEPPSSPISNADDLAAWCAKYKLDDDILGGLERLGFRIGDALDVITEQDYTEVGLKKLQWNRVLKANRLDRASRKHK